MKYSINARGVPEAIGPYSQGTTAGRLVFASGQLPISTRDSHALVDGGITEQTERVIDLIEELTMIGAGVLLVTTMTDVFDGARRAAVAEPPAPLADAPSSASPPS